MTRSPATFAARGDPYRLFSVTLPLTITVSAGSAGMVVGAFTSNQVAGSTRFDTTGKFTLSVGALPSLAAGQAPGKYTGTYAVPVASQ